MNAAMNVRVELRIVADERIDVIATAREHGTAWRTEPLRETDRDEVERRRERGRLVAARNRRVEQAGSVEVRGDVMLPRGRPDLHQLGQEEVYIALRGSADVEIDGRRYELDADHVIRVGATARRKILPGPDGVRLLAIGGFPGRAYSANPR